MTSLDAAPKQQAAATTLSTKVIGALRHSFAKFLVAGGLSAGVDVVLLYLLHGAFHVQLEIATFVAVIVSFFVNFFLNRVWSFGSQSPAGGQFVRYLILAGLNWVSTVALVSGFTHLGLYYLVAKALTMAVNSAVNYVVYKRWVFRVETPAKFAR